MDVKKPIVLLLTMILFCSSLSSCQERTEEQITSDYLAQLLSADQMSIARLDQFLTAMPKGGDIHHHYSGSIYAETYLDFLSEHNFLIDTIRFYSIDPSEGKVAHAVMVQDLRSNTTQYETLLRLWSDKDYHHQIQKTEAPDTHFFNTFNYFDSASRLNQAVGLTILKERAKNENLSYIETMLSMVGYRNANKLDNFNQRLLNSNSQQEVDAILAELSFIFERDSQFHSTINRYVEQVQSISEGIDDEEFAMRFQSYAVRVLDPVSVYSDLFSGFLASEKSELIVGVNIVAPENNEVALRDYTLHMRMYNYLHRKYPKVNRALHAGELAVGMVRPKDLLFHIEEAVSIANAQRIGHGVDIPYETNSFDLMDLLKEKNIAVEINLTSNEFILGIEGAEHPYLLYKENNIPMVICTDDSGVSRNNLTTEYSKLVQRYRPDYRTLKQYAYNSIEYSFLTAEDKVVLKKALDLRFQTFEQKIARLS